MAELRKEKEAILTVLLNLFTGGGGYIYIGQMAKGAIFIAGEVVFILLTCVLMIIMASAGFGFTLIGGLALCPLVFWAIITVLTAWDGYSLIQRVNGGQVLGKWEFFFTQK